MLAGPGRAALAGGAHGPRGGGRAAGAGGLRPFGGSFPAGGHGGLGGPRWLSTKSTASLLERPGSESGAGPGLESPSDSESDSESSEAREAAAAEATAGVGAPARLLTLAGARGLAAALQFLRAQPAALQSEALYKAAIDVCVARLARREALGLQAEIEEGNAVILPHPALCDIGNPRHKRQQTTVQDDKTALV
jgi:hypothetical protein